MAKAKSKAQSKTAQTKTMRKTGRKPLGRGLSALISTPAVKAQPTPSDKLRKTKKSANNSHDESGVVFLKTSELIGNAEQPRKQFDDQELMQLAESIKSLGIIQPILVRPPSGKESKYQIVAGERRYRAAKLAKLAQVPVIIRDITNRETMEMALVENIQRQNLNPLEVSKAYQALIEEFSLSQAELAERVGKSRSSVANHLRVLKLHPEILKWIATEQLSMGHAKAILGMKEPQAQLNLAKKILKENMSVRDVEDIVGRVVDVGSRNKSKSRVKAMVGFSDLENQLKNRLGTKVRVKTNAKGGGKIAISYYSEEELARVMELLIS